MTEKYQPKTMHHPQYRKSVPQAIESVDASSGRPFKDYVGTPELFPPVTVETADQEALYRSKGYFMPSESPPPPPEWSEYPVMLVHPDHVDAVPDETVTSGLGLRTPTQFGQPTQHLSIRAQLRRNSRNGSTAH